MLLSLPCVELGDDLIAYQAQVYITHVIYSVTLSQVYHVAFNPGRPVVSDNNLLTHSLLMKMKFPLFLGVTTTL